MNVSDCFPFHSYANELLSIKLETLSQGQENLTWNEIQNCIDMVNIQIQEENERKYGTLSSSHIGRIRCLDNLVL